MAIGLHWAALVCQLFGGFLASSAQLCLTFQLAPDDAHVNIQGFVGKGWRRRPRLHPSVSVATPLSLDPPGWLLLGGVFLVVGLALRPAALASERGNGLGRR
jgi:hypothetical protein